jgi:hypothetical protein
MAARDLCLVARVSISPAPARARRSGDVREVELGLFVEPPNWKDVRLRELTDTVRIEILQPHLWRRRGRADERGKDTARRRARPRPRRARRGG